MIETKGAYSFSCYTLFFSLALCVLSLADTARVDIDVVYLLQVRHFDSIPFSIAQRDDARPIARNASLYPVSSNLPRILVRIILVNSR